MTIQAGDLLPHGQFQVMTDSGPQDIDVAEFFANKRVILMAVPGAFTPTCSAAHLPGYVQHYDDLLAKGIDSVVCLAVNDVYVMDAWGKDQSVGSIVMAADVLGEFTLSMGLEMRGKFGLRSRRYAMLVDNGIVQQMWLEEPGEFSVSAAEQVLEAL
jgi:peroxiredoxin